MVPSLTPYDLDFPPKWGFHMSPIYANGHISATGDPIHMFVSRVGFSGTADRMALFPVRTNPRWRPPPSWKIFKWPYLRNRSIHFMFGSRVGFLRTADLMALSVQKIQDGGSRHLGKKSNGHISATSRPIHFIFGFRVGFSWTADPIALFPVRTNPRWQPPQSWVISNGHISATAHMIYLYSAHRAVIFAIAQLSCIQKRRWKKAASTAAALYIVMMLVTVDVISTPASHARRPL